MKGGCLCGDIRYEVTGRIFEETNCHCSLCRGSSGAPYIAWLTTDAAGFRYLQGIPAVFPSSTHGRREFCPRCGTQLTFHSKAAPDELDVTIASLDDPEDVPPKANSFVESRVPWVPIDSALDRFEGEVPRK